MRLYFIAVALIVVGLVGIGVSPPEAKARFVVVAVINVILAGVAVLCLRGR